MSENLSQTLDVNQDNKLDKKDAEEIKKLMEAIEGEEGMKEYINILNDEIKKLSKEDAKSLSDACLSVLNKWSDLSSWTRWVIYKWNESIYKSLMTVQAIANWNSKSKESIEKSEINKLWEYFWITDTVKLNELSSKLNKAWLNVAKYLEWFKNKIENFSALKNIEPKWKVAFENLKLSIWRSFLNIDWDLSDLEKDIKEENNWKTLKDFWTNINEIIEDNMSKFSDNYFKGIQIAIMEKKTGGTLKNPATSPEWGHSHYRRSWFNVDKFMEMLSSNVDEEWNFDKNDWYWVPAWDKKVDFHNTKTSSIQEIKLWDYSNEDLLSPKQKEDETNYTIWSLALWMITMISWPWDALWVTIDAGNVWNISSEAEYLKWIGVVSEDYNRMNSTLDKVLWAIFALIWVVSLTMLAQWPMKLLKWGRLWVNWIKILNKLKRLWVSWEQFDKIFKSISDKILKNIWIWKEKAIKTIDTVTDNIKFKWIEAKKFVWDSLSDLKNYALNLPKSFKDNFAKLLPEDMSIFLRMLWITDEKMQLQFVKLTTWKQEIMWFSKLFKKKLELNKVYSEIEVSELKVWQVLQVKTDSWSTYEFKVLNNNKWKVVVKWSWWKETLKNLKWYIHWDEIKAGEQLFIWSWQTSSIDEIKILWKEDLNQLDNIKKADKKSTKENNKMEPREVNNETKLESISNEKLLEFNKNMDSVSSNFINNLWEAYKPKHSVTIDWKDFLLTDKIDLWRESVIAYTKVNWKYEPRLFYFSNSWWNWHSSPWVRYDMGFSKWEWWNLWYEKWTVLSSKLSKNLENIPNKNNKGELSELYNLWFKDEVYQKKTNEVKRVDITKWEDNQSFAYLQNEQLSINETKELFSSIDMIWLDMNFSKIKKWESMNHKHLWTIDIDIAETKLNWKDVEIVFAKSKNNPDLVWVEDIRYKDVKVNSFWFSSEKIEGWLLTAKPIEYTSQLPKWFRYDNNLKQYGSYTDIRELIQWNPLIKEYKKQSSKADEYIPKPKSRADLGDYSQIKKDFDLFKKDLNNWDKIQVNWYKFTIKTNWPVIKYVGDNWREYSLVQTSSWSYALENWTTMLIWTFSKVKKVEKISDWLDFSNANSVEGILKILEKNWWIDWSNGHHSYENLQSIIFDSINWFKRKNTNWEEKAAINFLTNTDWLRDTVKKLIKEWKITNKSEILSNFKKWEKYELKNETFNLKEWEKMQVYLSSNKSWDALVIQKSEWKYIYRFYDIHGNDVSWIQNVSSWNFWRSDFPDQSISKMVSRNHINIVLNWENITIEDISTNWTNFILM